MCLECIWCQFYLETSSAFWYGDAASPLALPPEDLQDWGAWPWPDSSSSPYIDNRRWILRYFSSDKLSITPLNNTLNISPSDNQHIASFRIHGIILVSPSTFDIAIPQHPHEYSCFKIRGIDHTHSTRNVIEILQCRWERGEERREVMSVQECLMSSRVGDFWRREFGSKFWCGEVVESMLVQLRNHISISHKDVGGD